MKHEDYKDIFDPYEKLVEIEILGVKYKVPENNTLLRCFQYISMESVSFGDFCWNGDCANCQIWVEDADGKEKSALACRTKIVEEMRVVRLSAEIDLNEKDVLC